MSNFSIESSDINSPFFVNHFRTLGVLNCFGVFGLTVFVTHHSLP